MIRFGIVGFGLHAVRRLMPGFQLSSNCSVTALSRRDSGKAKASAAEYNIPHYFTSTDDLCRCPDVDAVLVTSPNACHRLDVLTALRRGKPVLCEKPMGMDADECREMVDTAHRLRLLLGVAQVFRFHESTARIRSRVQSGELGRLVFARSEFSFDARLHQRKWLTDKSLAGGGPIADIGVHCIDTLRYILQDEIVRVHARTFSDSNSGDVEAAAVLTLQFRAGTLGSVLVSYRAPYRTPLEIVGEAGEVFAKDALTVDKPVTVEFSLDGKLPFSEKVDNQLAYARQVDSFAAALEGRGKFPAPGEVGWQNQIILDAAYRSMRTGQMEPVAVI
ncbi:MAG TPA: Gfo/Idh/MocA family oxidoreductase [Terriglobales bacterium]|nr:Gfo/Idh/MocA family oxidoreductase [Terriglobales bacterium]